MEDKSNQVGKNACRLLDESRVMSGACNPVVTRLAGDGSQREFYRLRFGDDRCFIAIVPVVEQQEGIAEAFSSWHIGRHLFAKGVPVPKYFAFDRKTGLILSEDLGDMSLYEHVTRGDQSKEELSIVYNQVIDELVRMQVGGAEGFQTAWCWQTPRYDRMLMLERESGYFLQSLCHDYFGLGTDADNLRLEFNDIAGRAAEAPNAYFLHRDFQSRNIMLKEGRVRIIDFQGGRLGPLGYDLASIVCDPYVNLPEPEQEQLIEAYIQVLNTYFAYDAARFRREFIFLALQRNLQVLGAFAFLSKQRGKKFFGPFIKPALLSLQSLLAKPLLQKYSALKQLTDTCLEKAQHYDS
jgi:N-acetylmuramate 1-kinase